MSYSIHAISSGPGRSYPTLQRLPGVALGQAMHALIRHYSERSSCVVLRDCITGRRHTVEEAMRHLGLTTAQRWQPALYLNTHQTSKEAA